MGQEMVVGEKKIRIVLDELNQIYVEIDVGEMFLIFSKEFRVDIQFWELLYKLIIKILEVDKFFKRKGVKRDKLRIQEWFSQDFSETVVGRGGWNRRRRREMSKNWRDERIGEGKGGVIKEEVLNDVRNYGG